MNEYVEMIHTLTMEKEDVSVCICSLTEEQKEYLELSKQHALDMQHFEKQEKTIANQKEEIERLTNSLSQLQTSHATALSAEVNLSYRMNRQRQIEEIQRIYHITQQELQQTTMHYNTCKEREKALSFEIAEVRNNCRLLEENVRSEKNTNRK